eukprot:8655257-Alexandrium_andersonii.AAC.1
MGSRRRRGKRTHARARTLLHGLTLQWFCVKEAKGGGRCTMPHRHMCTVSECNWRPTAQVLVAVCNAAQTRSTASTT